MFYDIFIELCKNKKVSPSLVAKEIGLSNSTTTTWKRGAIPKSETLQKLADYFDTTIDFLLNLSPEDQEEFNYIEDHVFKTTGRSREEVHKELIEQKIQDIPFEQFANALDLADIAIIEQFKNVSDSQLKKDLLDNYRYLNRRGRIEAALRMDELVENERFHQESPSIPPSPKVKDTIEQDGDSPKKE